MKKLLILLIFTIVLFSCQTSEKNNSVKKPEVFSHDIEGKERPWFKDPVGREGDFTFAIISDLTGGERDRIFEVAVAQVNRFDPRFVLSVGDLIDGGTEDTLQLKLEWDDFDGRAKKLKKPFFHLGGNHDLTNPTMRKFWNTRYGPTYYHFKYNNVLFLMMDSEDFEENRMMEIYTARAKALKIINGEIPGEYTESEYYNMEERLTGAITSSQKEYFQKILEQNPDVDWTFVFMHKPVWLKEGQPEWTDLEALLSKRNFTLINGHYHSYSHRKKMNMDYIMLGTTGGAQDAEDPNSFDHISLVKMENGKPVLTNLRMDGILDESGHIPLNGDSLSFQAYKPTFVGQRVPGE